MELVPKSFIWVQVPDSSKFQDFRIEDVDFVSETNDSETNDYERNEFAKAAMQTLLLHGNNSDEWIAKRAFEIADAMIKQSKKITNDTTTRKTSAGRAKQNQRNTHNT